MVRSNRRRFLQSMLLMGGSIFLNPSSLFASFGECKIAVIVMDGLRPDLAMEMHNDQTTTISTFVNHDTFHCLGLSCTQTGAATLWTGVPPYFHKAVENQSYYDASLPEFPYKYFHIIPKLMHYYRNDDLFTVWVSGKAKNVRGNVPCSVHSHMYARIYYNISPGFYMGDGMYEDSQVEDAAINAIREAVVHNNYIIYVHYNMPDVCGHQYEDYDKYVQEAYTTDIRVRNVINELPTDTKIILLSDHGFNVLSLGELENGHRMSPVVPIFTNFMPSDEIDNHADVSRLIYSLAGGDPDRTRLMKAGTRTVHGYRMYGG